MSPGRKCCMSYLSETNVALRHEVWSTDWRLYLLKVRFKNCTYSLYVLFCSAKGIQCTVCLATFCEGDLMKKMPCNHLFHPRCILPWLEKVCVSYCLKYDNSTLPQHLHDSFLFMAIPFQDFACPWTGLLKHVSTELFTALRTSFTFIVNVWNACLNFIQRAGRYLNYEH